jgi:ribosomal protein L24E
VVQQAQCPAVRQISVCNDPTGQQTEGNPASTQPTLINHLGVSATIWVHDPWVATASASDIDYMACHELGHALGLAHQSVPDTCMSYAFARPLPNAVDFRSLGEMYGLPATTDPKVGPLPTTTPTQPSIQAPVSAGPSTQICTPGTTTATGAAPDVFSFGDAGFYGSTGGITLTRPVVGMASTPTGSGYWTVASDGGIFAFGDAKFYGSTGAIRLNQPIVGMARTPGGKGYWLVASDGGLFAFGDAKFYGSTGAIRLARSVVAMAATPSGNGYWLVASDGGVFAFGDAKFYGSTGNIRLNKPVVAMASTQSGHGYWMYAADGGIFTFGDAKFLGSGASLGLGHSVSGVAASPTGNGYWMVGSGGTVAAFGDARCYGSLSPSLDVSSEQIQAIVATPSGGGYWLATRRLP